MCEQQWTSSPYSELVSTLGVARYGSVLLGKDGLELLYIVAPVCGAIVLLLLIILIIIFLRSPCQIACIMKSFSEF